MDAEWSLPCRRRPSTKTAAPIAGDAVVWNVRHGSPPTGAHVVDRPHVRRLLDRYADRKLILVSAPAGSGKTTAVASWLGHDAVTADAEGRHVVWLTFTDALELQSAFWERLGTQLLGL